MNGQMSGPLRFLRFASVCAESRFAAGLISKDDLEKIRWHIQEGIKPEIEFLKRCFPDAAANITDWSFHSVGDYWFNHHDLKVAKVVSVIKITSNVFLECDGVRFCRPNIFHLNLEKGDEVYTHESFPIEKK